MIPCLGLPKRENLFCLSVLCNEKFICLCAVCKLLLTVGTKFKIKNTAKVRKKIFGAYISAILEEFTTQLRGVE